MTGEAVEVHMWGLCVMQMQEQQRLDSNLEQPALGNRKVLCPSAPTSQSGPGGREGVRASPKLCLSTGF